ncbi:MAG: DUF927 domain-containing protein [Rhodobacteraceae bacterium]|nr:DUF927 domain-containing protein [Paracoccaceae bacterium]
MPTLYTHPSKYHTPSGFERWQGGVYRKIKNTTDMPDPAYQGDPEDFIPDEREEYLKHVYHGQLNVRRTAIDLATKEHLLQVECRDQRVQEWLPRATCASGPLLARESKHGFDFRTHSCAPVVDFLMASTVGRKPVNMSSRQGMVTVLNKAGEEKYGYMLGDEWIGPKGTKVHPYPVKSGYAQAVGRQGDLDTWTSAFAQLTKDCGVVARWLTFSMFAAPLLRWVNFRTFVLHHYGQTAGGKTALAEFGAGVWGRSKEEGEKPKMVGSFNSTAMAMIKQCEGVDDLPLVWDELQAANFKNDHKQLVNLVMQICAGQARMRLTPSGEVATNPVYWRTVARFTGEQPLLGNSSLNLGGVTNRIIQLRHDAMKPDQAKALHQWMERTRCYGVAGHRYLQAITATVNNETSLARLRLEAQSIHDEIEHRSGSDDRRMAHLAVIALGQAIASKCLFDVPFAQGRTQAIEDALEIAQLADLGEQESYSSRTWDFLNQHLAAEPARYLDLEDDMQAEQLTNGDHPEIIGVTNRSKKELRWYIPSKVNALLRRHDYNPDRFWSDAQQEGRIGTTKKGGNTMPERSFGQFRARVYVVTNPGGNK